MVTDDQKDRLRELVSIFLEENRKLNLSAFRTEEDCWIGNVLDSLAALDVLRINESTNKRINVLDLGTGGGFPLLPLAIAFPQSQFVGIDSTQKKIDAIGRIVAKLGVKNVQLICGRSEELGRNPDHRERYDLVTARAVAPLNVLLEYASSFTKVGGYIICWKSVNIEQELNESLLARAELSCQLISQHQYELPGQWGRRQLLIFEKRAPLNEKYPRDIGTPKKKPLA